MLWPCGGPWGSHINIKGMVVVQYTVASALGLREQRVLHNLNICTTLRADWRNTDHKACCTVFFHTLESPGDHQSVYHPTFCCCQKFAFRSISVWNDSAFYIQVYHLPSILLWWLINLYATNKTISLTLVGELMDLYFTYWVYF